MWQCVHTVNERHWFCCISKARCLSLSLSRSLLLSQQAKINNGEKREENAFKCFQLKDFVQWAWAVAAQAAAAATAARTAPIAVALFNFQFVFRLRTSPTSSPTSISVSRIYFSFLLFFSLIFFFFRPLQNAAAKIATKLKCIGTDDGCSQHHLHKAIFKFSIVYFSSFLSPLENFNSMPFAVWLQFRLEWTEQKNESPS